MTTLNIRETEELIAEIQQTLGARRDGGNRNLIARCPYCGKEGKYGVYIGRETARKKPFMGHCFSCGASTYTLNQTLEAIGRPELMVTPTADIEAPLDATQLFPLEQPQEVDDTLNVVELPDFYKRTFHHLYLQGRGFTSDDYEYFPAGETGKLNNRYRDYVIFPVIDQGDTVGYVARHLWPKSEIDDYNRKAKIRGDFRILRFRNSTQNDFVRLLYNYDAVVDGETDTVIVVEGIFDVVALVRRLELYDNSRIAVVATFGKKISTTQFYKLQSKGVGTVVIAYDGDAVEAVKRAAENLTPFFEVLIADIPDAGKDWEELSDEELFQVFAYGLKTPLEYTIQKIQQR